MRRLSNLGPVIAVAASAAALAMPPGSARSLTQLPAAVPALRGTAERTCSQCHDYSVVSSQRHTPSQWSELVDKMTDLGLVASEEELQRIKIYLAETFPREPEAPPT
jgi:hypothetical protein